MNTLMWAGSLSLSLPKQPLHRAILNLCCSAQRCKSISLPATVLSSFNAPVMPWSSISLTASLASFLPLVCLNKFLLLAFPHSLSAQNLFGLSFTFKLRVDSFSFFLYIKKKKANSSFVCWFVFYFWQIVFKIIMLCIFVSSNKISGCF